MGKVYRTPLPLDAPAVRCAMPWRASTLCRQPLIDGDPLMKGRSLHDDVKKVLNRIDGLALLADKETSPL